MSLGPFDFSGGPFLALYGALFLVTIVAGVAIPRWLRPEGREQRLTEPEPIAYLAGGAARFADTVVARLLSGGLARMWSRKGLVATGRGSGRTAAEMRVLALPEPIDWGAIARAMSDYAEPVARDLERRGLMMDGGLTMQMRFWQTSPYLVLVVFGAIKWDIGVARERPVGFLTILLVATVVLAAIRFAKVDRRTRAGIAVVDEARERSDRLRRAPTGDETALAVALFGTAVLAGSGWENYHAMRRASGDGGGGSDSSSSSGDGGSGCGGGGCGGCGGGGD